MPAAGALMLEETGELWVAGTEACGSRRHIRREREVAEIEPGTDGTADQGVGSRGACGLPPACRYGVHRPLAATQATKVITVGPASCR